jgi:hypothetical protein
VESYRHVLLCWRSSAPHRFWAEYQQVKTGIFLKLETCMICILRTYTKYCMYTTSYLEIEKNNGALPGTE